MNIIPSSAEEYSATLDWFFSFIERWGSTAFLQKNLDASFINLLVLCNKEQNYPLAKTAYEKYKDKVSAQPLTKSEEIITDIIILTNTDGLLIEDKVAETNRLLSSKELASPARQKRGLLHLESFWLDLLNVLMNSRNYEEGFSTASLALAQLPKSTKIKAMLNNFYNNSIAVIHNNFARQANEGNYKEAEEILNKGLEKFPEDKTLIKDLSDLNKVKNML